MSSLYQITDDLLALDALLAEAAEGESHDADLDAFIAEYDFKLRDKVDAYGDLYQRVKADEKALAEEMARLTARRKALQGTMERLTWLVRGAMDRMGVKKLEGVRHTIAEQKNGGVQPLAVLWPVEALPRDYIRTVESADHEKLRAACEAAGGTLKAGDGTVIAALNERGTSVRFK